MKHGPRLLHDRIEVDEHWYGEARKAIVVSLFVLFLGVSLALGFHEYRRQQDSHMLHAFTSQLDAETEWMQRSAGTTVRGAYVDRVVTEHVPGGSVASCKARAGRDSNKSLSRCRSGFEVTRIVREYL